jgi:hypothetical protein
VFSAPGNNMVYKITCFQFQFGLVNKNTNNLFWFRPLFMR